MMKNEIMSKIGVLMILLCLAVSVQASHRVIMFNDMATEKILDMWPDFEDSVDSQARGMESPRFKSRHHSGGFTITHK